MLGLLIVTIGLFFMASPYIFTVTETYVPDSAYYYSFNFNIYNQQIAIPETEPYQVSNITKEVYLNAGDLVKLYIFTFSPNEIDATMNLCVNNGSAIYLSIVNAHYVGQNWTAPVSQRYNFVYTSNSSQSGFGSTGAYKANMIEHRQVPYVTRSQISFQLILVGIGLTIAGIVLAIIGFLKKGRQGTAKADSYSLQKENITS